MRMRNEDDASLHFVVANNLATKWGSPVVVLIHDICHRYHRSYLWRKNLSCGENSDFSTSVMWRNPKLLHIHHVEKTQIYPHDRCWEYELSPHNRWGEFHHLLIYQINNVYNLRCFYVYYAVLLQNLFILRFTLFCRKIRFCRDLRAFAWRKTEPKIVPVEKKGQISCMYLVPDWYILKTLVAPFCIVGLFYNKSKHHCHLYWLFQNLSVAVLYLFSTSLKSASLFAFITQYFSRT